MADLRIVDAPLLSTVKGTEKIPTGGEGNFSVSVNQVADFAKLKWFLATEGYVDNAVGNVQADLNLHKNSVSNPHQVTKEQVGLGNVNNTADLDKPVSNATQSAIITANSGKADKSYVDSQDQLKADKNTVEASLLLKADKVFVDTQLNLKADKTYVETSLSLKADKTYVDSAVGAISTDASKQYATLALANADIANITLNKNIFVSEAANGGYWYKATAGATTLTKSAYDPLAQAKADATTKANAAEANAKSYVDGKIKKTIVSRNLVDPATIKNGYTLNSSGAEIVSASFHLTDFIEAKPGDVYSKTASTGVWCEYDVSRSLVKYTTNAQTITTQANTKYIRASLVNSQVLAVVNDGVLGDIDEYTILSTLNDLYISQNALQKAF